jgi:hypothetical protein
MTYVRRTTMETQTDRRRLYVSGQLIEIWENPDLSFGCGRDELASYAANGNWVLLFNAMMLAATPTSADQATA